MIRSPSPPTIAVPRGCSRTSTSSRRSQVGISCTGSILRCSPSGFCLICDGDPGSRLSDSQPRLVFDDAEPYLCRVDGHLLADEGMLGAGVYIAKRAFESSALADRAGPRNQVGPLRTAAGGVGCVDGGHAHVRSQCWGQIFPRGHGSLGGGERVEHQKTSGPPACPV